MDEVHNDGPHTHTLCHNSTVQAFEYLPVGVCKHTTPHEPDTFQLRELKSTNTTHAIIHLLLSLQQRLLDCLPSGIVH